VNNTNITTSANRQLEDASWELMAVYENLSIIFNSVQNLAQTEDINQAASITLKSLIEITLSSGGLIALPSNNGLDLLVNINGDDTAFHAAQSACERYQNKPYYEDKPKDSFCSEDGSKALSSLYVPFDMEDGRIGVVLLFSIEQKLYTSIDVKFTQILSSQGALAFRSFLHLERIKEKNITLEQTLKQLVATQNELVRSERLSALGQMASLVVHDLKNPMGGILSFAQLLEAMSHSLSADEINEYAGAISKETLRLSALTEEIMDFSQGVMIKLDLRAMTSKGLMALTDQKIRAQCEKNGIEVVWEGVDDENYFLLDSDKMERIFINLANNACQAMEKGGSLIITTEISETWVEFQIKDTGDGIPPDIQDKIFEPFATRIKGKCMGLGLALAKWIVEAHKGEMKLHSTGSDGTEFRVKLPVKPSH